MAIHTTSIRIDVLIAFKHLLALTASSSYDFFFRNTKEIKYKAHSIVEYDRTLRIFYDIKDVEAYCDSLNITLKET